MNPHSTTTTVPRRPTRIAVAAALFRDPVRTGVHNYATELVKTMAAAGNRASFELVLFTLTGTASSGLVRPGMIDERRIRIPSLVYEWCHERRIAPPFNWLTGKGINFFLYPGYSHFPLSGRKRSMTIIYDLCYLHTPEFVPQERLEWLKRVVPRAVKNSSQILTISNASKRDIVETFSIDPATVVVAPPGVDFHRFRPVDIAEQRRVRERLQIPRDRYVLFHGTLEPRKNIEGVLNAFAGLPDRIRRSHALVLSGSKGWRDEAIIRRLDELRQAGCVVCTPGYVDNEDLAGLMGGAELFVYPSLFEGFGMPVTEAMACGAPVVTSNISSLPEAANGGAVLVDPADIAGLSRRMGELLDDPETLAKMRQAGPIAARPFRWEQTAAITLAAIERLCGVPNVAELGANVARP